MALTTSLTTLASKATPRNGFGGASTVWPALSSSRITPANPDASAKAPWTRTTVGPGMGSPEGWRGDPNDATSPDPSEPTRVRRPGHRRGPRARGRAQHGQLTHASPCWAAISCRCSLRRVPDVEQFASAAMAEQWLVARLIAVPVNGHVSREAVYRRGQRRTDELQA